MKATLFNKSGEKKSEIELPKVFSFPVREDISQKCFEVLKFELMAPYSPFEEAGRRHSASGTISHRRHKWKGHYGKGMARVPRKKMWRRGTQFYWIGTEVSGTRGGRTVHTPSGVRKTKKMNKRELQIALSSAIASTASKKMILSRYSSLSDISHFPVVIESLPEKSKEIISTLKNIYGDSFNLIMQTKSIRSGKGKRRGRKYKSNQGMLIVKSRTEKVKTSGVDIKNFDELKITDLFPLGRITLYTKKSLEEMKDA